MSLTHYSGLAAAVSMSLILAACASQTPNPARFQPAFPGTDSRPVLSAQEAGRFTPQHYFALGGEYTRPVADGWMPTPIDTSHVTANYVVGPQTGVAGVTHTSIQQAVNAALHQHPGKERVYIKLLPGTYTGRCTAVDPVRCRKATGAGRGFASARLNDVTGRVSQPRQSTRPISTDGPGLVYVRHLCR